MKYESPVCDIVVLENTDIVRTSGELDTPLEDAKGINNY